MASASFSPPAVTQRALERLASRHRHEEVEGQISKLLGTVTTRRVGDDEDTLMLRSERWPLRPTGSRGAHAGVASIGAAGTETEHGGPDKDMLTL